MNDLNKRQILIIRNLINAKEPLSSDVLSVIIGTATRTVRNSMEVISKIFELTGGARIISRTGIGYYLEIFDDNEFRVFTQTFHSKYLDDYLIPTGSGMRVSYLICRLLFTNDYIKVGQLSEELYVSRVTVTADLKEVRKVLFKYHLRLEQRSNHGLRLFGDEIHIRAAMADYLNPDEDSASTSFDGHKSLYLKDPQMLTDHVTQLLIHHNISISAKSLNKLVKLIIVSEYRALHGLSAVFSEEDTVKIQTLPEFSLAGDILDTMSFLKHDISETCYLAIVIASRRNFSDGEFFDSLNETGIEQLCEHVTAWILKYTGVDLAMYPSISRNLAIHFRGMWYRLYYGLEKRDVNIFTVKGNNPAFEYAVIASRFFAEKLDIQIQESEIAFLSYRFYPYFESISSHRKMNLIVVLSIGKNAADFFINELMERFGRYIDQIRVAESYQLAYLESGEFDCILTDIPAIGFDASPPVMRVNYFLSENDNAMLSDFFTMKRLDLQRFRESLHEELYLNDLDVSTKEDAIRVLAGLAEAHFPETKDLCSQIFEREDISSTEQGNCVAIPHTSYAAIRYPLIVIGILKKSIIWENEKCRLVLLVYNGTDDYAPFSALSIAKGITKNIQMVYQLIKSSTFSQAKDSILECADRYCDT